MRTINQYLEAAKARKENGEAGFSLVELIVVVVILGILAAVAIPIFNGIQNRAEANALKAAVGTMASQVTANVATGEDLGLTDGEEIEEITYTLAGTTSIDTVCVTGTKAGVTGDGITAAGAYSAGPGC